MQDGCANAIAGMKLMCLVLLCDGVKAQAAAVTEPNTGETKKRHTGNAAQGLRAFGMA